eukprot:CAMPEP_0175073512 /NCGR_PEP_ID=MMETSP0052_2-20121109/20622_1 /TAXON_ID=51329 ORGANISM="Polytomella parva, Strain SAG 63-3" /NCGR_SAMPLE_ID=MMETSP0052_2 /ASSEMBLY_ACC=CAM_ASM_000194 /LENGTH=392 /DNA_ID=CAMNT_0016341367 /DNA_START=61 /DNA_END=1236 /DNA_ORIENTATION=-
MGRTLQLAVLGLVGFGLPLGAASMVLDSSIRALLFLSACVSFVGYFLTLHLIPAVAGKTEKRGICGKDLNKKGTPAGDLAIPEAAGLAPGCVFLLCVTCFQFLHYYDIFSVITFFRNGFRGVLHPALVAESWIVDYNAALATIGFMLFLGFVDDVLDVRWRVKLILPLFASLPLLVAYSGGTTVSIPRPLQSIAHLPSNLDLGWAYLLFMVLVTVFSTNSINILAGVNGLEAGQTFVIACSVLLHNILVVSGFFSATESVREGNLFSAYLMFPLAAVSFALLWYNWYPSRVFVGDTFTYFAGMTIAVAGILGHFSETLLIFLLPQVLNFIYSLPQLFKIVPCPRHRLPVFDPQTGLLRPKDQPDWNLVNLFLQLFGRCGENALCIRLLVFQT